MAEPVDYHEAARSAAAGLKLLNAAGKLRALDSLTVVNLTMALEDATGIHIPTARVVPEEFKSLETIAALLANLASGD